MLQSREQEMECRTEQARQTFNEFKPLLCNRNLFILLYGMETWTNISPISKLEAFGMWTLQRIFRIPWTDRVRNGDVLRWTNTVKELLNLIK